MVLPTPNHQDSESNPSPFDSKIERENRFSTPLARTLGWLLIAVAFLANEWFANLLAWKLLGHSLGADYPSALRCLQGVLLVAGTLLTHPAFWKRVWHSFYQTALGQFVLRRPDYKCLRTGLPLAFVFVCYMIEACIIDEVPLFAFQTIVSLAYFLLISVTLFITLSLVASKLLHFRGAAIAVSLIWAILIPIETLVYYYGGTRLERHLLGTATPYSLGAFFSWRALAFATFCIIFCGLSGLLLSLQRDVITWNRCARWSLAFLALQLVNVPMWVTGIMTLPQRADARNVLRASHRHLTYIGGDSVINAARLLWPNAANYQNVYDFHEFQPIIAKYQLPIDSQPPAKLDSRPFKRVILVFCESMSSFFIKGHNGKLPGSVTPYFFDSEAVQAQGFRRHRTVAQPTLPGLAVTFCSHPNAQLVRDRRFPQSFVSQLGNAGWRTAFFSSVSKYYDSKNRHLQSAGFQEFYDRGHFASKPECRKFIDGWGACDRLIYDEAVTYLQEHRDEQTFVCIEGCDTHMPHGRINYCNLKYPAPPAWISQFPKLYEYLLSIHNMDYDIHRFCETLRDRQLLDEDTLVVITADHCCPVNRELLQLPGATNSPFEYIPLVFLSGRSLPLCDLDRPTSQVDVAASILHLMRQPIPTSYWGRSVFDNKNKQLAYFVGFHKNTVMIEGHGKRTNIQVSSTLNAEEDTFISLFRSYMENETKDSVRTARK